MNDGGRPPAVRRFLRRPTFWLAFVVLALPVLNLADERNRKWKHPAAHGAVTAEGVAGEASYGGVDVTYRNPVTGQEVEAFVGLGGRVAEPAPGTPVRLVVDRDDPENLRLAGDDVPETLDVFSMVAIAGAAAGWWALRRVSMRRSERLAAGAGPAFAMIASLEPPRRLGRRPCLHLWPLDAGPGTAALCAVPVLTTGGLPVGGPAFPVEVKGSPRDLGRVVARAGSALLWPASRGLLASWARRPQQVLTSAEVQAATTPPTGMAESETLSHRPADGFVAAHQLALVALAAALGVLVVVAAITAAHANAAADLERDGVNVVAEVTRRLESSVAVTYRLPGEERERIGRAPAEFPEDQKIGLRLPTHVDPDHPERLRFARDPYDAREPVLWAVAPVAALGATLGRQRRIWTTSARLSARGPWRPVSVRRIATNGAMFLAVTPAGVSGPWVSGEVRVVSEDAWRLPPAPAGGTFALEAAGGCDPGDPIALRCGGAVLRVTSRIRWPRSARRRGGPMGFSG